MFTDKKRQKEHKEKKVSLSSTHSNNGTWSENTTSKHTAGGRGIGGRGGRKRIPRVSFLAGV
jgi:hypothetical protein